MDLYGTSGQAIANGNMRSQSVRDMNDRIRQHNDEITNQIQSLKEQTQTADNIKEALDTGKTLWAGSKMPGAIEEYQKWKAKKASGQPTQSNPESETNSTLRQSATENDPLRQGMNENQLRDMAGETTRAEGSPSGASLGEEASVLGGAKGKVQNSMEDLLEDGLTEDGVSKLGKAAGALGGATNLGIDIYQDFKGGKGFHLAGDNWEEKTGNALNAAGSVADIVGTFYPPAAIVGGAVDLVSDAFNMIGSKVEDDKKAADLDQQGKDEQVSEVSAPEQETITTGRTE